MLSQLTIEHFRAFRRLSVPSLGAVNLVVGRNNTGKTTLLEAAYLQSLQNLEERYSAVGDLLDMHDEVDLHRPAFRVEALYHGRQPSTGDRISISSSDSRPLSIQFGERTPGSKLWIERSKQIEEWLKSLDRRSPIPSQLLRDMVVSLIVEGDSEESSLPEYQTRAAVLVRAGGLDEEELASWWDAVVTTDAEDHVLACMQILVPTVRRIAPVATNILRAHGLVLSRTAPRRFVLRLEGEPQQVPLKSLGDGVARMFEFALALERARNSQLLLLDEVENGIHHQSLPDLWRFLIKAACTSKVQVIATTHSWDCIRGFHEAMKSLPDADGRLIRLERAQKNEDLRAVVYDRDELHSAIEHEIEVR